MMPRTRGEPLMLPALLGAGEYAAGLDVKERHQSSPKALAIWVPLVCTSQ